MNMKCPLGNIIYSENVRELMSNDVYFAKFVVDSLIRHSNGEWFGESRNNELALRRDSKIYSVYIADNLPNIAIITCASRASTLVRFPDENYETLLKY